MNVRRPLAAAGLVVVALVAAMTPAVAASHTVVKGAPSTRTPALGFEVPVRGTVKPAARRTVELRVRANGHWLPVARTRSRADGTYTLWYEAPSKQFTYRVFAPATKKASKDRSGKFTLQGTTADRIAKRVYQRSCNPLGGDRYELKFRLELTGGERFHDRITMVMQPHPLILDMRSDRGVNVRVDQDFSDVCP